MVQSVEQERRQIPWRTEVSVPGLNPVVFSFSPVATGSSDSFVSPAFTHSAVGA